MIQLATALNRQNKLLRHIIKQANLDVSQVALWADSVEEVNEVSTSRTRLPSSTSSHPGRPLSTDLTDC